MDLSKFKAKDSTRLEIIHPEIEGVVLTLAGPNHPATLKAKRERESKLMRTRRNLTPVERENLAIESMASRVLGWEGIEWDGKPLQFSEEAAKELLSNPDLSFIRDQVALGLADDEGFFSISNPS